MSDRIQVSCPNCGKNFRVDSAKLGRSAKCSGCGQPFKLEAPAPADTGEYDLAGAIPSASQGYEEQVFREPAHVSAPVVFNRSSSKGDAPAKPINWSEQPVLHKVGSVAIAIVLVGFIGWLKFGAFSRADNAARRLGESIAQSPLDDRSPAEINAARAPVAPPPPPRPQPLAAVPAITFKTEGRMQVATAVVTGRKSMKTQVHLYVPAGAQAAASVPCVFVAPAGSTGLSGVPLGDDEQKDFLPLLKRGIAVCCYTLDGTVRDLSSAPDLVAAAAMMQYQKSNAGMANLSDAIDTVLAGAPMIDPQRLATCGHSSAGSIAIMATVREPRIRAAAVMAPAIGVSSSMQEFLASVDPQTRKFVYGSSPSTIDSLTVPVYILHASDDTNCPLADSQAFAQKHGAKVTLKTMPSGGHMGAYTEGREPCFAFLEQTLKSTP